MIIDSHQHFWEYDPIKHSWIDDSMSVIRRDFSPEDLKKVYKQNGIDGCVAVQADQTTHETDFLLDLSERHSFIKGIVGWVDLRSQNLEETLLHYAQFEVIKGFRHVVQDEEDVNFMLRDSFCEGISLLEEFGFTYDILVFPHQLGTVLEFVKKFPDSSFVIDHIAKPYVKDGFYDGWAKMIREISKFENVHCKLSGMITEADYSSWNYDQLAPYMELVLSSFGPYGLMFGSDWPVCTVAGDYSSVKSVVEKFIAPLSEEEKAAIMGQNAINFYNL